jgi:hypothetical protein
LLANNNQECKMKFIVDQLIHAYVHTLLALTTSLGLGIVLLCLLATIGFCFIQKRQNRRGRMRQKEIDERMKLAEPGKSCPIPDCKGTIEARSG